MKLIPIIDFVLIEDLERLTEPEYTSFEFMENVTEYAKFLKQPLELCMFLPVDGEGNVLDRPKHAMTGYDHIYKEYQKAKDRCLFKGFEIGWISPDKDLMDLKYNGKDVLIRFYVPEMKPIQWRTIEDLTHLGLELKDNTLNK